MYIIIIYMILIFYLLIKEKYIEGQETPSTTPISSNTSTTPLPKNIDIIFKYDNKIIKLNVNTNDKISIIKNKLYKQYKEIPENQLELVFKGVILNNSNDVNYYKLEMNDEIQVKDTIYVVSESGIKQDYTKEDIPSMYDKFVKALNEFYPLHKKKKYEIYNDDILKLFKIKSKPVLKPYNDKYNDEYSYIDIKQSNNNEINNKKIIKSDNNEELCCYKPGIDIQNERIETPLDNISQFIVDKYYIPSSLDTYKPYNKDYYDYMEEGNNIYKYLVGSMYNLKNPGNISPS